MTMTRDGFGRILCNMTRRILLCTLVVLVAVAATAQDSSAEAYLRVFQQADLETKIYMVRSFEGELPAELHRLPLMAIEYVLGNQNELQAEQRLRVLAVESTRLLHAPRSRNEALLLWELFEAEPFTPVRVAILTTLHEAPETYPQLVAILNRFLSTQYVVAGSGAATEVPIVAGAIQLAVNQGHSSSFGPLLLTAMQNRYPDTIQRQAGRALAGFDVDRPDAVLELMGQLTIAEKKELLEFCLATDLFDAAEKQEIASRGLELADRLSSGNSKERIVLLEIRQMLQRALEDE